MHPLAVLGLFVACVKAAVPTGRAAWVYDVNGGQPAMWSPAISSFNANTKYPIEIVYSYGGDMEYYPGSANPYQTYFTKDNQEAATIYSQVKGVKSVILVIDGRMDGGESYSPDLSKLNATAIKKWADVTAALYCSFPQVSGIQIDLEPMRPPYTTNLLLFLAELAADLQSSDFNCKNAKYPSGRALSTFLMAGAATPEVYKALGPEGFTIISGYDLSDTPAGTPITPAEYATALTNSIKDTLKNVGPDGKFALGLPAAASTHEFLKYVKENGQVVQGYPNYSNTTASYMTEAANVISDLKLKSNPSFLGVSLWGFSSTMAYPPHSNNLFFPSNPFSTPGEELWLQKTDL